MFVVFEIDRGGPKKSKNKSDIDDLKNKAEMLLLYAIDSWMKVDRVTGGVIDFAFAHAYETKLSENPIEISLDGLENEEW